MALFTVYQNTDDGNTSVPNLFIDEYMKEANDAQIKVYLYIVRMMNARRATSLSDMADHFNHTEKEVLRSLRYWEKMGVLTLDFSADGVLTGIHLCELKAPKEEDRSSGIISITPDRAYTDKETSREGNIPEKAAPSAGAMDAFMADKKRAQLLFIVEQYIGKTLSVPEVETLYYISETLKFNDDLIDYLVQYCVDRGKKDFRYIEKVAVNWAESGITTPRQAQRALSRSGGKKPKSTAKASSNSFTNIMQHNYDFDELEKKLLQS